MRVKLVHGVGVNDLPGEAHYPRRETGDRAVHRPAYQAWKNMIMRAYSQKYHAKQPTYCGVTVANDWLTFSAFKAWFDVNHVDGWDLDKDLLSDARQYSPDNCIYIPRWLNQFIYSRSTARGIWPIGVIMLEGRFLSRVRNPKTGKKEHLGTFGCPDKAHDAWAERKRQIAFELKPEMDEIDERIYPRVVDILGRMK